MSEIDKSLLLLLVGSGLTLISMHPLAWALFALVLLVFLARMLYLMFH